MWQCDNCGARYHNPDVHRCHQPSVIRYQVAQFPGQYERWLASPAGQFAQHYAQRMLGGSV